MLLVASPQSLDTSIVYPRALRALPVFRSLEGTVCLSVIPARSPYVNLRGTCKNVSEVEQMHCSSQGSTPCTATLHSSVRDTLARVCTEVSGVSRKYIFKLLGDYRRQLVQASRVEMTVLQRREWPQNTHEHPKETHAWCHALVLAPKLDQMTCRLLAPRSAKSTLRARSGGPLLFSPMLRGKDGVRRPCRIRVRIHRR